MRTTLLAVLVALPALATGDPGITYLPAQPLETPDPPLPPAGGGWVHVNFVVAPDGTVDEVMVVDAGGTPALEKLATDAIAAWKYEPARLNGEAVPQRLDRQLVAFDQTEQGRLADRRFIKAFDKASEAIDAGKLDAAELKLLEIRDDPNLTVYAWSRVHTLLARLHEKRGDKESQMQALALALPYSMWNAPELLRRLFGLQVETRQYRGALATYDLLRQVGEGTEFAGIANQVQRLVEGTEGLRIDGEIRRQAAGTANASWHHDLLRRRIAFDRITGVLDSFQVQCPARVFSAKVDPGQEWTVPDDWGPCTIVVIGQPGTRFHLLEMAPAAPARTDPDTPLAAP